MASIFGSKSKSFMTMSFPPRGDPSINRLMAISLPQDVPSTSDHRIVELENQVQCLMEAHCAPKSPVQVNKIASSCEICSGPNNTQHCMENPEQAFVEYASSLTDEAGDKWYTFKPEQNNLGNTYNSSWKSHPNLRLSKFEADFKQQQGEMTNKIDTFLKAINDRMTRALPSDTVKNPKLNVNSTSSVLSALSYLMDDPQCSSHIHNSINAIKMCSKQTNKFQKDQPQVKTLTVNENGTPQGKGIKIPSNLLSPKYQSQSSLGEQYRNSSSPKRVHFINTITILSKEDEPGETGIVKPGTKDNDHDTIVKVEEEKKVIFDEENLEFLGMVSELLSDYECEIKYHSGKANVVADALSRKERLKPRRVRAMSITIHSGLKTKVLEAQSEASKDLKANSHG
ncbi:hypothetical protein Tco_0561482 [Tanacetum coccineum]